MTENLILMCEYGSTAHGTNTEFSDRDYMGIAIEQPQYVAGISDWADERQRTAAEGERSTAGDTDQTIYSLRKWARLAAAGNPTVLTTLFVKDWVTLTDLGHMLVASRHLFLSQEAGRRYRGYMQSQRDAMTGLKNKRTNRPELIHQFGYDTKFAYHMCRLGIQGIDLMTEQTMHMPMQPEAIDALMAIRNGKITREEVLDYSWVLDRLLDEAITATQLPQRTDRAAIDALLVQMHLQCWSGDAS